MFPDIMRKISISAFTLICTLLCNSAFAQTKEEQLDVTILSKDSVFWQAYNNCDLPVFGEFISDDVEFYHDKGGITLGKPALIKSIQDNLCGNRDNFRLKREAVAGTVQVYAMKKNNVIYGAVVSGEHIFSSWEKGKAEYKSGQAKFTHLWLLTDGVWKMTRIFSYSHEVYKD
jgi:hypothetical protein